jgi:hypothetical protein
VQLWELGGNTEARELLGRVLALDNVLALDFHLALQVLPWGSKNLILDILFLALSHYEDFG